MVFAHNTNFSVADAADYHSIVSQFVTITDSVDVYYYLFDGGQVCRQGELARMVEHSLCMREV